MVPPGGRSYTSSSEALVSPTAFPISGPGFVWSAAEVADRVAERAAALAAEIRPGRPHAVPAGQTASDVIEALAVWDGGGVLVPLHPDLPPAQRARTHQLLEACPDLPDGAAALLWTSGTAGRPTGVVLGRAGLEHVARSAGTRLGVGSADVWAHTLSPATMGGLATLVRARTLGHGLRADGPFDAERLSAALDAGSATFASLVPVMLDRLLQARRGRPFPRTVRGLLLGGAATPRPLVEAALALDAPLFLTYGLTEASSQVATAPPELVRSLPGTVGPPLDGVEIRIAEGGGIEIKGPALALARIEVASPVGAEGIDGVAMDAMALPAGTAAGSRSAGAEPLHLRPLADGDGWYPTGDLGRLDDAGRLFVTGRAGDRIISGGVNVDPQAVEAVLLHHESVADVCVVGMSDPEWGERAVALVVPAAPGTDALVAALVNFARSALRPPERPRDWVFVEALPRNRGGKLDRAAALRIVRDRPGRPGHAGT